MNHLEDSILVKGFLLTRSERLFRQLYRKHTPPAYQLALKLTDKDVPGAEDIIQEAWIRAVEHVHDFKWNASFKTWFTGIVINCCREYLRRKKGITFSEEIDTAPVFIPPDHKIDLRYALALLPLRYREVLLLHDLEGWKHADIGQLLGISEGTSKSQLFHARKAIQKLLN
jgi:RNA polymerase sigma-70 factor (ECF subfamily)